MNRVEELERQVAEIQNARAEKEAIAENDPSFSPKNEPEGFSVQDVMLEDSEEKVKELISSLMKKLEVK